MWGTNCCAQGWGAVSFVWIYEPLCRHLLHCDPWSIQAYGWVLIGIGIFINLFQKVLEL